MINEEKIALIQYRLERANESFDAAKLLFENKMLVPAMNRIYYSMFYSIQALLILNETTFSKHGQVKGFFNREYIKKGIFPISFGKLFNTVFEYRQKYDYVDLILPDKEVVSDYISEANTFIRTISEYIDNKVKSL